MRTLEEGFLLIGLEADWFALPVGDAREILQEPPLTPVPGVTSLVKGIMNLRGQLVTVLEPAWLLDRAPSDDADRALVVVVQRDGIRAGIAVDRSGDVISIDPADRCSPQGRLPEQIESVTRFVATFEDRLICGLDLGRIFDRVELSAVEEAFASPPSV
jgi:purine-binding chemotaxis protein CheW